MFTRTRFPLVLALVMALASFVGLSGLASAHGHTMVGDYQLVIGFKNEPAYQSEPNGLDLTVTNTKTNQPVKGLEKTLQVEIIQGSARQALPVKAQFGLDGKYTAYVLPTAAGDYTWHIFGTIENTPVDMSMTSSPTTFNSVQPKASVSFPAPEATTAELLAQLAAATRLAVVALVLAVLLGGGGLVIGLLSRRSAVRARQQAAQPAVAGSKA